MGLLLYVNSRDTRVLNLRWALILPAFSKWITDKLLSAVESAISTHLKESLAEAKASIDDVLQKLRSAQERAVVSEIKTAIDLYGIGRVDSAVERLLSASNEDRYAALPRLLSASILVQLGGERQLQLAKQRLSEALELNPYLFPKMSNNPFAPWQSPSSPGGENRSAWKWTLSDEEVIAQIPEYENYGTILQKTRGVLRDVLQLWDGIPGAGVERGSAFISRASCNNNYVAINWIWSPNLRKFRTESLLGMVDYNSSLFRWTQHIPDELLCLTPRFVIVANHENNTTAVLDAVDGNELTRVSTEYWSYVWGANIGLEYDRIAFELTNCILLGPRAILKLTSTDPDDPKGVGVTASRHIIRERNVSDVRTITSGSITVRVTNDWWHYHWNPGMNMMPYCVLGCTAGLERVAHDAGSTASGADFPKPL